MQLVKDIPEVSNVVVQDDVMYDKVIEELRPDYVIHGDNWQEGALKAIRDNVEGLLKTYGGEIIDVPYTYNEEVKRIDTRIKEKLAMPEYRRKRLRQLIEIRPIVKALEVHSGLTDGMSGQLGNEGCVDAVVGQRNSNVGLAAAEAELQVVGLNEALIVERLQTDHQFAKSNDFHGELLLI